MTFKKWVYLFWTTLLIGSFVALIVGFFQEALSGIDYGEEWFAELLFSAGLKLWSGAMFSIVAQLGFFAFSILNVILLATFKNSRLYQSVLWVLLAFAFADLIYLRYHFFAKSGETLLHYTGLPLFLMIVSLFVAWWKARETNVKAFASTAFFMFVVTVIELFPALQENIAESIWFMLLPLLACNTWQIMQLHRLLPQGEKAKP